MQRAQRLRLRMRFDVDSTPADRGAQAPLDWFEIAVAAADKAFILAAAGLGLALVALLVYQNLLG